MFSFGHVDSHNAGVMIIPHGVAIVLQIPSQTSFTCR
jgi:hypothetical protein